MKNRHEIQLRAPAPSPMPEDLGDLMNIALGIGRSAIPSPAPDTELGEGFIGLPGGGESGYGMSETEIATHRKFMHNKVLVSQTKEVLSKGSHELKTIRDQILEELEWQRLGIIDHKQWLQKNEEELKKMRVKLAAKRGWDAIRGYIQAQMDNKTHRAAMDKWRTMFKVARKVATVNDKVVLDLYERYGFLGWEKRLSLPPHNPMFPVKNVQMAKERAVKLQQLALEQEMTENMLNRTKSYLQRRYNKDHQQALQSFVPKRVMLPSLNFSNNFPTGRSGGDSSEGSLKITNSRSQQQLPNLYSENGGGLSRAATSFNFPASPMVAQKLRREQTTIAPARVSKSNKNTNQPKSSKQNGKSRRPAKKKAGDLLSTDSSEDELLQIADE